MIQDKELTMVQAKMMLHCDAFKTTRQDLAALPIPESMGTRHKPIPHIDFIEELDGVLKDAGLEVTTEKLGVTPNGMKLFGALTISPCLLQRSILNDHRRAGQGFALAYRKANDQSMAIKLLAGLKIFVCDNMAMTASEDAICLGRKHTTGIDLRGELQKGIHTYIGKQQRFVTMMDRAREYKLEDEDAKLIIYDAFVNNVLPGNRFPKVHRNYFEPEPEWKDISEFPRTLWALHNAFTRECRDQKPTRFFKATEAIGGILRSRITMEDVPTADAPAHHDAMAADDPF